MSKVTSRLDPTGTGPASTVVALAARCELPVTAAPVTGRVTPPWSVVTVTLEAKLPAAAGSQWTARVTDCCGASTVPRRGARTPCTARPER